MYLLANKLLGIQKIATFANSGERGGIPAPPPPLCSIIPQFSVYSVYHPTVAAGVRLLHVTIHQLLTGHNGAGLTSIPVCIL